MGDGYPFTNAMYILSFTELLRAPTIQSSSIHALHYAEEEEILKYLVLF